MKINPTTRASLVLFVAVFLMNWAQGGWYVDNSFIASRLGGPSQFGPFHTQAEALAAIASSQHPEVLKLAPDGFDDIDNTGTSGSGAGGYQSPPTTITPTTTREAVLLGVQQGIQQGMQNAARNAAEQQRRQAIENDRVTRQMIQDNAAQETIANDNARILKAQASVSEAQASQMRLQRANDILSQMRPIFEKGADGDAPVDTRVKGPSILDVGGGKVPSGLPKFVEDSIPKTPAGDRMRKGFEAIQEGDWKVALAWFQDALNKDPGDPTLQRLVDLAQFTLVYRTKMQAPPVANNSTPAQAPPLNTQKTTANSTSREASTSDGDDILAISTARGMAARKRAEAAFEEYVRKYGPDYHVVEKGRAMSKAMRGEGYTNEELKDQLRQALKEYHKKHDSNRGQWIGSPDTTAEEVSIGGKG